LGPISSQDRNRRPPLIDDGGRFPAAGGSINSGCRCLPFTATTARSPVTIPPRDNEFFPPSHWLDFIFRKFPRPLRTASDFFKHSVRLRLSNPGAANGLAICFLRSQGPLQTAPPQVAGAFTILLAKAWNKLNWFPGQSHHPQCRTSGFIGPNNCMAHRAGARTSQWPAEFVPELRGQWKKYSTPVLEARKTGSRMAPLKSD